jgi:hypothetical protein
MNELSDAFATSPEELAKRSQTTEVKTEEVKTEEVKTDETKAEVKTEEKPSTEVKSVEWLEGFNKDLGTQFKAKEEILGHIEKAKKADEYEQKVKTFGDFEKRELDYKKQLEEVKSSLNPLKYFSSTDAYIAEQLRMQHPDKNPMLLQEIATSDLSKMDGVEILIKGVMLDNKDVSYEDARSYILNEYGIAETPQEEWSAAVKTKIKVKAGELRKELGSLKAQIKMPEVTTDEQKAALAEEYKTKKAQALAPYAETFSKFDKFTAKIDDNTTFEFATPDEYKASLEGMFKGYFLDGGQELNPENLKSIEELRSGLMLLYNFPKVYKAIEGDVTLRLKAETDKKLGNEAPENKAVKTDDQTKQTLGGMDKFLNDI